MTNKIALITGLILYAIIAIPAQADFWSGPTKIETLYPTGSRLVFITEYSTTLSTCNDGRRFSLDPTYLDYETEAAALMAAFFSGRQVDLHIIDNGPMCDPKVDRFLVY